MFTFFVIIIAGYLLYLLVKPANISPMTKITIQTKEEKAKNRFDCMKDANH